MVAAKIKAYVDEKGIKQTVIARKAGLTDQELSAYLTGRIRLPADRFFAICEAIGVSPETFKPDTQEVELMQR